MLATCFIDIDDDSSSIIGIYSLSCSVLAFVTGIALNGVSAELVQDLVRRLWNVDPEICEKLNLLVKENETLNCFHVQPRNRVLRVCGKVKILLSICRDALSCVYGLQNQSNSSHEEEITKSCKNLLSQTIMKWMQIPFGTPKYFFNIRPCVGAELFARSKSNLDTISIEQGFQLSLDLCLQVKNIQQRPLTKLYCLLYTKLAFHTLAQKSSSCSTPWRDEDLVEMSNKLFHHHASKKPLSRFDCNNKGGVTAIVEFEPNERGQGFSSCLLDVSRFPIGSYQIKWLSCCVDEKGSYWNLLPLNSKPVFTVKKAS